jgi:pyridoxal phosphate enzyme (YggS family)
VGHLQSNKAGKAVELFDVIHSVDGPSLAAEIGRRALKAGKVQRVLIQVNCSGEESKSGCSPDDAIPAVTGIESLELEGFMTIGPLDPDPESARPAFRRLRGIRDSAEAALGKRLPVLSMGMTGDLEVAVEEGATLVRVGTALFGERPANGRDGRPIL